MINFITFNNSCSYSNKKLQRTYLVQPLSIIIPQRFMYKIGAKVVGHAPKLLKALETKVPEVAVAFTTKVNSTINRNSPDESSALLEEVDVYKETFQDTGASHFSKKNDLILYKYYIPSPLIYTPKDYRFLIWEDGNRFYLSGIASLTSKERKILQYRYCDSINISMENHIYYINYAKMICLIKAQIFYYGFQYKHSLNITKMLTILQKIYSMPVAGLPWLKNKAFKELYEQKAAAMIQHFLVMTYGNTEFSLSLDDPNIVSDAKTGTILTVVELFTAYKTCSPSILKDLHLSLRLITPEVEFLKTGDIFNCQESLGQINQQNSDCLAYALVIGSDGIRVIKYYRDVKMDYKGPLKGHFSFKALVSIDFMSLKTLMNDLVTTINRLCNSSYNMESKKILERALTFFRNQEKAIINTTNLKEIYKNVKEYLVKLTFNETLTKNNIHFSVIIDFETNSDPIMKEIVTKIEQDPDLLQYLDPEIHYPRSTKISLISWKQYHELSLKGIRAHLPVATQESIVENYIPVYVGILEKQITLLI